jgi:diguanylate cyclase (GGDEF)-like protein
MSTSNEDNTNPNASTSGSAAKLEEVLNKLDLEKLPAPMLRKILSQTMGTLKIARRRVDEQQRQLEVMGKLSTTDMATGLLNMRGLHLVLRRILARAKRNESGGALIVIDLDGFKAINDIYGHLAGDKVLSHVSRFLVKSVREGDVVARLGGDEFAILMPDVGRRDVDLRAAAISDSLNNLIVPWDGRAITVRGSVGGACYGPDDDMDSIYKRADEDMYRQKSNSATIRPTGGKLDA